MTAATLARLAGFCAGDSHGFESWFYRSLDRIEVLFSNPDDFLSLVELDLERDASHARSLLATLLRERDYRAPFNADTVRSAEARLGVQLPDAYVSYARAAGHVAGEITVTDARLRERLGESVWEVESIWKMEAWEPDYSILQSPTIRDEWGLPEGLIVLGGSGHEWNVLDYRRGGGDPPVALIESDDCEVFELAPSFSEFMRVVNPFSA